MTKVAVIDYGAGNLSSVCKAVAFLGHTVSVAASPGGLEGASHVILPGVGAFGDGMAALRRTGFDVAIPEIIRAGKPFLGICLGMQLLFEESHELGRHKGLGIFPGAVEPMRSETLKIPHMGWNRIAGQDDILYEDGSGEAVVYFVHSFFRTTDGLPEDELAAVCDYVRPFAAAVRRGSCLATQFHPEKSGDVGMAMLRRFLLC